jgi:glycosyltransferase involved in cell wall biosynthesis
LRKKTILYFTGSSLETQKQQRDLFLPVLQVIYYVSCTLADSIIVYSERNVKEYGLVRWTNKISFFQEHLIDTDLFYIQKSYNNRNNIIGYIGRFSEEKGIINFVESIPLLKENLPEYSFFIGGDGPLRNDIEKKLNSLEMNNINFIGWIDHQQLPEFLNELKLLVLPSFTEGLPNIMLEAFACGTPVLATPVGAIPDIIIDGKTGYLMENNSPECIKNNVVRVLKNDDIKQVITNAESYVLKNFEFEKKVEDFGDILKKSTVVNNHKGNSKYQKQQPH